MIDQYIKGGNVMGIRTGEQYINALKARGLAWGKKSGRFV
jgi:hypothetical protein